MGDFGAAMMVTGNFPGKTNTMPITIYSEAQYGGYGSSLWMVLIFAGVAAAVVYISTRMSRKAVKV